MTKHKTEDYKKSEKKKITKKKYASCCFFVYLEYFSSQDRIPVLLIPTTRSRHQNPLPCHST